jgi:hypothetical protein
VDGCVAVRGALCKEGGRYCAAIAVAAGEAFPSGLLDGAVMHWAMARREGAHWGGPPAGWVSDPANTQDAGTGIHTPT